MTAEQLGSPAGLEKLPKPRSTVQNGNSETGSFREGDNFFNIWQFCQFWCSDEGGNFGNSPVWRITPAKRGDVMETVENNSNGQISEKSIVAQAQQGDPEAFQFLYHRYKGYVSGQCRRLGCDSGLAEELTQDVFIQLWEKLGDFKGRSAFRTWLHRIAVNIVFRHFRRNKRKLVQLDFTSPSGESTDLSDRIFGKPCGLDDRIFISQLLSSLPSNDRSLILLHTAGFKHKEIAHILRISGATSRSQLFRARARMQRQHFGLQQNTVEMAA